MKLYATNEKEKNLSSWLKKKIIQRAIRQEFCCLLSSQTKRKKANHITEDAERNLKLLKTKKSQRNINEVFNPKNFMEEVSE